jgi:hypothetical protein
VRSLHSFSSEVEQHCYAILRASAVRAKWTVADNFDVGPLLFRCLYPHGIHKHSLAMCRGCCWSAPPTRRGSGQRPLFKTPSPKGSSFMVCLGCGLGPASYARTGAKPGIVRYGRSLHTSPMRRAPCRELGSQPLVVPPANLWYLPLPTIGRGPGAQVGRGTPPTTWVPL